MITLIEIEFGIKITYLRQLTTLLEEISSQLPNSLVIN